MPWAPAHEEFVGASCVYANIAANSWCNASARLGNTYLKIYESTDNASRDYVLINQLSDGTADIIVTITYFTS